MTGGKQCNKKRATSGVREQKRTATYGQPANQTSTFWEIPHGPGESHPLKIKSLLAPITTELRVTTRRRGETALPTHPCTCHRAVWRRAPRTEPNRTELRNSVALACSRKPIMLPPTGERMRMRMARSSHGVSRSACVLGCVRSPTRSTWRLRQLKSLFCRASCCLFYSRAGGRGSRTLQQGLAGGGRGKLASAHKRCECEPECPRQPRRRTRSWGPGPRLGSSPRSLRPGPIFSIVAPLEKAPARLQGLLVRRFALARWCAARAALIPADPRDGNDHPAAVCTLMVSVASQCRKARAPECQTARATLSRESGSAAT